MNLPLFITRRMALGNFRSFSGFIVRIAILAVALSISVMIIATAMVNGFQREISNKLFGFLGHVQISSFKGGGGYDDAAPIAKNQPYLTTIDTMTNIRHVQAYARKAGIITTEGNFEGIVLKGVDTDFDWSFFEKYIVSGKTFTINDTSKSNLILLSQITANRMHFSVGDSITVRFVQNPPRARRFIIAGIYNTGMEEYDERYALVDIKHIQKLNEGWQPQDIGGFEVFLNDINQLDATSDAIYNIVPQDQIAQNLKSIDPNIFEWLNLQNMNEVVIIVLMLIVAVINMITALLILILERTNMIGVLKALGATNWSVRKIFLYNAAIIASIGLVLGNIAGLGLCWLQQKFGFITLPEESYYISTAPIAIDWFAIAVLNIGTLLICVLVLLLPTWLVTKIEPVKAIKFQ
ncbi:MAG: ABC transporter permease [Sphingobacteriales bacterium]|nr:ABC transporter permease [Sphingobacteriales bacterium]MBP9140431.1 ABC transporter permease [Chitinophagales bacterium]MDA0197304.1 FtsX-like permease family protein [Bacteroidota bacterium]MBK6890119.1 ABC transporter permease [Sphingobacteriales bacterium]MBK7527354.1 ABC transporter permease [Sphingobacteriales bacterium]